MIKNAGVIKISKHFDQHGLCYVCGKLLEQCQMQLAHIVERDKPSIRKYGLEIINHPDNLIGTCAKCNQTVLIGKGRTARIEEHINKIKCKVNGTSHSS